MKGRLEPAGSVAVLGAGALGSFFAARLLAAGSTERVELFTNWLEAGEEIRRRGVRVQAGPSARLVRVPLGDGRRPEGRFDVVLVLTKSYRTRHAARLAARLLSPGGVVVTLQNGLGNVEQLEERCGEGRVLAGATTVGVLLAGPGSVRHTGGDGVALARHPEAARVARLFRSAGFEARSGRPGPELLWAKLVVSSAILPVGALARLTNGELARRRETRELMVLAARETAGIARAAGVRLTRRDPAEEVLAVALRTAPNRCSMLQDLLAGRRTEIDAISCAVVRAARPCGAPSPVNAELARRVKAAERDARGHGREAAA